MLIDRTTLEPDATDDVPGWVQRGRVPCLDGLRGLSILLVLIDHLGIPYLTRWPSTLMLRFRSLGVAGVDVFFVISGLLITLLLQREQAATGAVSLQGFYYRRVLRIFPAYFTFAAVVWLVAQFNGAQWPRQDWLAVVTYTVSLCRPIQQPLQHLWSLSVEELFYLVWPAMLFFLSRRTAIWITASYLLVAPALRAVLTKFPVTHVVLDWYGPTRADSIAIGCLLAFAVSQPTSCRWLASWLRSKLVVVLTIITLLISLFILPGNPHYRLSFWYRTILYHSVNNVCLCVLIGAVLLSPASTIARLLEWRLLTTLGVLSYSIYLWQQPIIASFRPQWWFHMPASICIVALLAVASHYLVERPFLRLKARSADLHQLSETEPEFIV